MPTAWMTLIVHLTRNRKGRRERRPSELCGSWSKVGIPLLVSHAHLKHGVASRKGSWRPPIRLPYGDPEAHKGSTEFRQQAPIRCTVSMHLYTQTSLRVTHLVHQLARTYTADHTDVPLPPTQSRSGVRWARLASCGWIKWRSGVWSEP